MSGVTDNHGLILPASGEPYSVDITNSNNIEIDKKLPVQTRVNSTLDTAATNCTSSVFTRIKTGENSGIIIAKIICFFDVTITLPANTASAVLIGTLIPAGFRPAYAIGYNHMILSGAGQGGSAQFSLALNGELHMRANGATYNTVAGSQVEANISYPWDGIL